MAITIILVAHIPCYALHVALSWYKSAGIGKMYNISKFCTLFSAHYNPCYITTK